MRTSDFLIVVALIFLCIFCFGMLFWGFMHRHEDYYGTQIRVQTQIVQAGEH